MANDTVGALPGAKKVKERLGVDELRWLVKMLDHNDESFNQRFTAEELLRIGRAQRASGWDFYPDQWRNWQVDDALAGIPPQWDSRERPVRPATRAAPSLLDAAQGALGLLLLTDESVERDLAVDALKAAIAAQTETAE